MYVSLVYRAACDHCQAVNFVSAGDPSDLTGFDPEGFICHRCLAPHRFDGEYADGECLDIGRTAEQL